MLQRTQAEAPAGRPSHPEPRTLGHAFTRSHPGVPRPSRACSRALLSLPFLGHSVIRFLNLEAAQGSARDPCPHPHCLWPTGLGPAVGPRPGWGRLFLGGSLRAARQSQARPHPAAALSAVGAYGATQPAATLPATLTRAKAMGPFFLLLNHGLGTKPQGGEVWTKEKNEWTKDPVGAQGFRFKMKKSFQTEPS